MQNMQTKIIAIHQPNFFPWLGYFDKIRNSDLFVFMDNVSYPKSGNGTGSWCNRVKINIQGNGAWIGCPIRRESGVQIIKDVQIDDKQPWRKKLLKTLEMNYKKAKFYPEAMEILTPLFLYETDSLAAFNINAITTLCKILRIPANFARQSDRKTVKASTELLIEIISQNNGTAYLCGGGASGYQDDALIQAHNIELIYQNYQAVPYGDTKKFLPGLSVIDFLMHGGY